MNIATLTIEMAANVARLRQDMDNAASVVQSATARMQKAAELAGKALGLIGVGLSMSAITGIIRNAIDAADALDEMSGRVGVSAKELSGLQLAYKQAGMGNEAMSSSLAKLSREMSEGNVGLRALGVNTRNADGSLRGTTAVLLDVADKFKGMEDGAAKTALAMEIFGKSGAEMVPLLNSGAEGIAEMTAMAEKLGLVIEDSTAAQAGQFNDTLELLGLGVQGVGTRIAAQLLPTLTSLTGSFLESMTSGDRLARVSEILAAALKILYTMGVGIVEVFSTVGKTLGAAMGQVLAILRGDFAAASEIGKAWKEDVTSGWAATSEAIKAAWSAEGNAAVTSAATQMKAGGDLLAQLKAREEAAKKATAAANKLAEEEKKKAQDGAKLAASLLAQDSGLAPDFAEKWDKLNAAYAAGHVSLEQLTAAQKELLEQQPAMKEAMTAAVKASQDAAAARKAESDGIEAFMAAQRQAATEAVASINARIRSMEQEGTAAQLAREKNISLAQAVELVAIARLKEEQSTKFHKGSEGWEAIEREIEARERLAATIGQQDIRQREEQGWTDMWASVDRTAHDTFVNVFEGGSNVFKKLGQTLKASVLDLLYQMVVRKWVINIGTSILGGGFGSAAAAATGASTAGSAAGSALNIASMFGAGGLGGSLAAGAGWLTGATTLGGSLSAGMSLLGTGTMAGGLSGLGMIAGALGPIALGIGAVMSLVKNLDDSGTMHTGALSQYSAKGGAASSTTHGAFGMGFGGVDYSAETEKFTGTLAQSIVTMLDSTAVAFGKDAGYRAATAFADDTSKDGAWGGLLISKLEETLVNWDTTRSSKWAPREFADGAAGKEQYLAAVAADLQDQLMQVVDGWAKPLISALGDGATLEQLAATVDQINALKASFVSFGQFMPAFAGLADSTLSALIEASGGAGALSANMASFVGSMFTEAERLDVASTNLSAEFAKLGLEVPRTTAEYKALLQAQMALGDAGAATAARLLGLSGAFMEVVGAATQVQDSLGITADTLKGILESAVSESRSPTEASELASAAFEEQIKSALFGALTGGISEMLMSSIVGPLVSGLSTSAATASAMLTAGGAAAAGGLASGGVAAGVASAQGGGMAANAMAQGGAAAAAAMAQGGAIAGANVQAAIAQAHASISAYAAIMSDPSIQDAIKGVSGAIGAVAGDLKKGVGLFVTDVGFSIGAATGLSSAMGDATESMKSLTDAIVAEVKRIRGVVKEGNPVDMTWAGMQSEFALATAKARAGDKTAADKLPELSKALLQMAESQMRSAADLRYFQATTAASLQATAEALVKKYGGKLPAFADGGWHAGGWAMVGERGPEVAYLPPSQIYTAAQTQTLRGALGSDAGGMGAVIGALQSGFGSLDWRLQQVERNTGRSADLSEDWDRKGVPVVNRRGTKLETTT